MPQAARVRPLDGVLGGSALRCFCVELDSTLENGGALPIDIIEAGLLPEGYELGGIKAIPDNARLLAGTARDAEGTTHGWLLRLRDTCSP